MTSDNALRACPFCGTTALSRHYGVPFVSDEWVHPYNGCFLAGRVFEGNRWNTRSPVCEDAREELVERLVNARDQLKHLQAFPKNARGQATAELIALIEAALAKVPQ